MDGSKDERKLPSWLRRTERRGNKEKLRIHESRNGVYKYPVNFGTRTGTLCHLWTGTSRRFCRPPLSEVLEIKIK